MPSPVRIALQSIPVAFALTAAFFGPPPQLKSFVPVRWVTVPSDLSGELAIYPSVFWEPLDSQSLRKLLREQPNLVDEKSVLEIGTGSGLIALCCKRYGARRVVATDINPTAFVCAQSNARRLGIQPIDFRLVPSGDGEDSGAFSVVGASERFDLIISNPPWEDATPRKWSEYALYDQDFELLRSILTGCRRHLHPEGKILLAYGCVEAIRVTRQLAAELGMQVFILDDRDPDSLPDVFLPGMLLGVIPSSEMPTQ